MFDPAPVRADFPILARRVHGRPLVYLDNAASAQKPAPVIDAQCEFEQSEYANVHRGLHYLSNRATERYEAARESARHFINARETQEIVFTGGATEAINLAASSYASPRIEPGSEIILSVLEHHSNIVPWHFLRERQGAVIKWIPADAEGALDLDAYAALFSPKTVMVALTEMSNVLGVRPPLPEMIARAHEHGVPVLVDGCQGIVHGAVDVQALDCDFYVFSGHKLYGPTGIGVLYGRRAILEEMRPFRGGGEMIREVSREAVSYGAPPHRFEGGTPPIIQAAGLDAAIAYVSRFDRAAAAEHEGALLAYAREQLAGINSIRLLGKEGEGGSILSFVSELAHPHDLAALIDRSGVAVRAGHHCAQPLMAHLGITACARASLAMYNTREDIDRFAEAVRHSVGFFS